METTKYAFVYLKLKCIIDTVKVETLAVEVFTISQNYHDSEKKY